MTTGLIISSLLLLSIGACVLEGLKPGMSSAVLSIGITGAVLLGLLL